MATYTDDLRRFTTVYSTPNYYQRGMENVIEFPVYRDGELATCTGGTVSVFGDRGEDDPIVDEQAVTVVSGVATYTIASATTEDEELSDTWTERWTLTFDVELSDHVFIREAALVRTRLYPVITDADLVKLHTEIRDWRAEDQSNYQDYIDAAWDEIQISIMERGDRPYLILSSYALRTAHIDLTLAMIFRDYSSSSSRDGKYKQLSDDYFEKYRKDFERVRFRYDKDQNGLADEKKQSVDPVVFLNVPASWTGTTGGI